MLLLLHKTLKDSRNIQGFALIRAVLLILCFTLNTTIKKVYVNENLNRLNGNFVAEYYILSDISSEINVCTMAVNHLVQKNQGPEKRTRFFSRF